MSECAATQNVMRTAEKNMVRVVIETPQRSRLKYKFDQQSESFLVAKILPEGMMFP